MNLHSSLRSGSGNKMTADLKPKVLLVGSVEYVPQRLRQVESVAEVVVRG